MAGKNAAVLRRLVRPDAKQIDPEVGLWHVFCRHCLAHEANFDTLSDPAMAAQLASRRAFREWFEATVYPRSVFPCKFRNKQRHPQDYSHAIGKCFGWFEALFGLRSAIRVVRERVGFGLELRQSVVDVGKKRPFCKEWLHGDLHRLHPEVYETLRAEGHDSLIEFHGVPYIMTGPLSLINERHSLQRTYLAWTNRPEVQHKVGDGVPGRVWVLTTDKWPRQGLAAGQKLWCRYDRGAGVSVPKSVCFCPDCESPDAGADPPELKPPLMPAAADVAADAAAADRSENKVSRLGSDADRARVYASTPCFVGVGRCQSAISTSSAILRTATRCERFASTDCCTFEHCGVFFEEARKLQVELLFQLLVRLGVAKGVWRNTSTGVVVTSACR